ncbi:MAG: VanW family protein [Patescibacteria group bacterium]|nr:VanW family protein [Patescibacteria group bacterium]
MVVSDDLNLVPKSKYLLQKIIFGASIIIVILLLAFFGVDLIYKNKVLPRVAFADVNLGGATITSALHLISDRVESAKLDPITLKFDNTAWTVSPEAFDFRLDADVLTQTAISIGRRGGLATQIKERFLAVLARPQQLIDSGYLMSQFNHEALMEYLNSIANDVDQEGRDAKLVIKNNRVVEFVSEQTGHKLDVDRAVTLIASRLLDPIEPIELPVKITRPKITLADTNTLGIETLVARGVSDFSGSPRNRRHNIGVGAGRFDGLIIKPDATFSFVQNLGNVDASTGYLPELVIKGDETVPEYGGGLCQVSTTAFRAILNGGLPVVERRNHSYRVVYYEPAGTDATIYQPYPDLKFKNDTGAHIFMDTYIEGTKLYFDFYGTDTGRTVELDGPRIFNVTDYPEPIYIDTSTLEPGEIQQVDIAHRGADAVLYRKVYKDGKLILEDTFKSHYIPWPAKYLRGVEDAGAVEANPENILPEDAASEEPLAEAIPDQSPPA